MTHTLASPSSMSEQDSFLSALPSALDEQADQHAFAHLRVGSQWERHKRQIDRLLSEDSSSALRIISRLVDTLELYAPNLKGLQNVHKYAVDTLEALVFSNGPGRPAAAFLLGHAMALNPLTAEAISLTIENILLGGASDLAIQVILGTKRADVATFEAQLPALLKQIQMTAFNCTNSITQYALKEAMKLYDPSEPRKSQRILEATHAVFAASLRLCQRREGGLQWACFIICNTPMLLRNDLRKQHPETCDASLILECLLADPESPSSELCIALPILCTWETSRFCAEGSIDRIIHYMLTLPSEHSFNGLGQTACVILEKFAPHLPVVAKLAIDALKSTDEALWASSQLLLRRLLSALGPIALDSMLLYLHSPAAILLKDVRLLELISSLLPDLRKRIIQVLVDAIAGAPARGGDAALLAALAIFPLEDEYLAHRAQEFVLWSLDESRDQAQVLLALQLAIDVRIATPATMRGLTHRAAQLLLADDGHIVHMALSALSNPILASTLDEKSCQMILLALHQSLEPSIQIVAAKLLTHLSTGHRAIVQPLAWAHIRQSLSLMDFLQTIDPTRAIVEACIISNLLPALPTSVHAKYVGPVKNLILLGLERTHESMVLSLIFQGLANLTCSWKSTQQFQLAVDLLDMSQEIPKDSQHAALNAISRLLAAPQDRSGDLYDMLLNVHTTFRKTSHLDPDSKALVAGIYGHLGTIERNPVISRDSRAAILRESAIYDKRTVLYSQVAEARDRSGAGRHINWLVSKALLGGKLSEEVLEAMTGLGILQPGAMPVLVADLPSLIMRGIHTALDRKANPQSLIILLSSSLHASPGWLQQYWAETADLMAGCLATGEILSVLKGMDVILQASG